MVRSELDRRRREGLHRSLANPHPETAQSAEESVDDWAREVTAEDAEGLLDSRAGQPICWIPGEGWVETSE